MLLLRRAYGGYLSGKGARKFPVDGIKEALVAHGQAGQFYRHLVFISDAGSLAGPEGSRAALCIRWM